MAKGYEVEDFAYTKYQRDLPSIGAALEEWFHDDERIFIVKLRPCRGCAMEFTIFYTWGT